MFLLEWTRRVCVMPLYSTMHVQLALRHVSFSGDCMHSTGLHADDCISISRLYNIIRHSFIFQALCSPLRLMPAPRAITRTSTPQGVTSFYRAVTRPATQILMQHTDGPEPDALLLLHPFRFTELRCRLHLRQARVAASRSCRRLGPLSA